MKNLIKLTMAAAVATAASAASAETVLTVSTWASPKHSMNSTTFPRIDEILKECSGGDLSLKLEYGLAPPPAQYDTIRDGVADMSWIVHGYTPGKFVTTKLAELPGIPGNAEQISVAYQMTHEKYLADAGHTVNQIVNSYTSMPSLTTHPTSSSSFLMPSLTEYRLYPVMRKSSKKPCWHTETP